MDLNAASNSPNASSIEHLISKSLGGSSILENFVLCHPRCNRILANRPLTEKIKLRDRRRRKLWRATLRPPAARSVTE